MREKCCLILKRLPAHFDLDTIAEKFPITYDNSVNSVIQTELLHFNSLIAIIKNSMQELHAAIDGEILLTPELKNCYYAVLSDSIPPHWAKNSYRSLQPLSGYTTDFLEKIKFFQKWIDNPYKERIHWFPAFFYPHLWIAGLTQNFARDKKVAVDAVEMEIEVTDFEVANKDDLEFQQFLKVRF